MFIIGSTMEPLGLLLTTPGFYSETIVPNSLLIYEVSVFPQD